MLRKLILGLALTLGAVSAQAGQNRVIAVPTNLSGCGPCAFNQPVSAPSLALGGATIGSNALAVNGQVTFNNGTLTVNNSFYDPVAEHQGLLASGNTVLSTGNNSQEVEQIEGQEGVDPGIYTFGISYHTAGVYGHGFGVGSNSSGAINAFIDGVVGMADNEGISSMTNAASFFSHNPANLTGAGTLVNHYAFYDQGCTSPAAATNCYGASFDNAVGAGTTQPVYGFDDHLGVGINTTTGYYIGGVQISASNLSNGTSGSGAVALVGGPTFTSAPISIIAGAPATYYTFKQDGSTVIGTIDRPASSNATEFKSYDDLWLTPAVSAAGLVRIRGGTPTIASGACGATTNGTISGNNQTGKITIGSATTTACAVSFSGTVPNAPNACTITPATSASAATTVLPYVSAITTGGFTVSGSALASTSFYYICL